MKHFIKLLLASGMILMMSSCATHSLDLYAANSPRLVPQEFFVGKLEAQGVLKNRSGEVTRYFTATINAHWDNGIGTLEEHFIFNDGEKQARTWTLTPAGNSYKATAGDVIGEGSATVKGNAMNLRYLLEINYQNSPLQLRVDDWMWLVDKNTIINESTLSKWGFKVGSIQLVIRRLSPHELL